MIQIIWSSQALRNIEAILAYIAEDSPRVAELVVGRIVKAVERLKAFPGSGRKVPERNDPEVREVIESRSVYRMQVGSGGDRHSFPRVPSLSGPPITSPPTSGWNGQLGKAAACRSRTHGSVRA